MGMKALQFGLPPTTERVERNTSDGVNEEIAEDTRQRVRRIAEEGPRAVDARLDELEREWDIERLLETNAASISLASLALGHFVHPRWYLLTGVVAGFLLQHAVQGWCPPVPIMRRLGVRTAREIEEERAALRILRGDFEQTDDPDEALEQARG
jgi:hypothetical protein